MPWRSNVDWGSIQPVPGALALDLVALLHAAPNKPGLSQPRENPAYGGFFAVAVHSVVQWVVPAGLRATWDRTDCGLYGLNYLSRPSLQFGLQGMVQVCVDVDREIRKT